MLNLRQPWARARPEMPAPRMRIGCWIAIGDMIWVGDETRVGGRVLRDTN